jgi:hypothetical protein
MMSPKMMSGSRASIAPGSLVQLRRTFNRRYISKIGCGWDLPDGVGVVIKSLGTDPNAHECFEVLFSDKMMTAWDDELEKLTDAP